MKIHARLLAIVAVFALSAGCSKGFDNYFRKDARNSLSESETPTTTGGGPSDTPILPPGEEPPSDGPPPVDGPPDGPPPSPTPSPSVSVTPPGNPPAPIPSPSVTPPGNPPSNPPSNPPPGNPPTNPPGKPPVPPGTPPGPISGNLRILLNLKCVSATKEGGAPSDRCDQTWASGGMIVDMLRIPATLMDRDVDKDIEHVNMIRLPVYEDGNKVMDGDQLVCLLRVPSMVFKIVLSPHTALKAGTSSVRMEPSELKYHPVNGSSGVPRCTIRPEGKGIIYDRPAAPSS
jgi:hypothetical protein